MEGAGAAEGDLKGQRAPGLKMHVSGSLGPFSSISSDARGHGPAVVVLWRWLRQGQGRLGEPAAAPVLLGWGGVPKLGFPMGFAGAWEGEPGAGCADWQQHRAGAWRAVAALLHAPAHTCVALHTLICLLHALAWICMSLIAHACSCMSLFACVCFYMLCTLLHVLARMCMV